MAERGSGPARAAAEVPEGAVAPEEAEERVEEQVSRWFRFSRPYI